MTVLQFPERGSSAADVDDLLACECGSVWFQLLAVGEHGGSLEPGAVVLNQAGNITGYTGIPHCTECGKQKLP